MEEKINDQKDDLSQGKQIAWLSYLWILVIVPLLVAPQNEYVKFHVRQGIALLILEIGWALLDIFLQIIPIIRYLAGILNFLIWIAFLILIVMGIIYSVQGEKKALPIIGEFAASLKII